METSTKSAISMKKGRYSKIEILKLETEFRANQYPSNEKIIEIGELLSRTVSQIKHWFNDQRYKVRNETSGRGIHSAKNATSESIVRSESIQSISSKNEEKELFENSKSNKSENSENESNTITKNNVPKSVKLILESEFIINQYPTKEKIAELAQTCNRTKRTISQWFSGKRLSTKSSHLQKPVSKYELSNETISTADYDTKSKGKTTTFHSVKQKIYSDDEISKLEREDP